MFDVIIEGDGMRSSAPIFAQSNPVPRTVTQNYKLRLHEHANYQWLPILSAMDFQKLLSNITSIKIRGTYTSGGIYVTFQFHTIGHAHTVVIAPKNNSQFSMSQWVNGYCYKCALMTMVSEFYSIRSIVSVC